MTVASLDDVRIRGLRTELPAQVVPDEELAALLGTDAASVAALSKGRPRMESPDGEGPGDLAERAFARLAADLSIAPGDLDCIVFATNSSDLAFPGTGCTLQAKLDAAPIACLDLRAQCSGLVVGLDVARRFVAGGMYRRVLVAAGDVYSHVVCRTGAQGLELASLVGDGAAVAVVEAGEQGGRILAARFATDGSRAREFWCEFPASRSFPKGGSLGNRDRLPGWSVSEGRHCPVIDRAALRETALARVPEVLAAAMAEAGREKVEVLVIAHLDPDVEAELADQLAPLATTVATSDLLYSGAATAAITLDRMRARGEVAAGATAALVTSGSGASWGATILEVPA